MIRFFILLVISSFTHFTYAQSPEDSVKRVINRFFEGMNKSDTVIIRNTISSSAVFQTISAKGPETESIDKFILSISKAEEGALDERIVFETIKTDGALASVWTPYSFYFKGKFSHCGVNSFQLVRIKGEWKIQYIIDTRRKKGCLEN